MPVVDVAPFISLVKLDVNLLVHPGLGDDMGVVLLIALKSGPLLVVLEDGVLLVILDEEGDDLEGLVLEPLHVKVDFGAELVLGGAVLLGGVGVGVVDGTPVAAGDDGAAASLLLQIVEELDQNRIDAFFPMDDGEAVARTSFAVGNGDGGDGLDKGGIERSAFTAEKIFGDPGKIGFGLPRIGGAGGVLRNGDRTENVAAAPIDVLGLAILPANLLLLRLLQA